MKKRNCFIHLLLFLLWIPLFSCNSQNSDFDDRVRNHFYQSNSYFKNYIIDSIRYDTIGTGQWSYNLATLMIDHPDLFSDKGLLDELVLMLNDIDTTDCRIRLIANVYGRGFVYYIGVIGDSLTNLEEKLPFSDAPIEAILNICSPTEKRILDIANVIELSDRRISSFLNKTLLSILSNDYSVHCFSKTPPIFNAKGHTKDTTLRLQFTGVYLNDNIDSVILMHPTIIKEFSYDNYSRYYLKNKIETRSGVHKLDTHIYTIKNRIVLIKSVCNDEIVGELYELFKAKYGEDVSVYSYDETFFNCENGSSLYFWSFSNNGIILVENSAKYDTYYPDVTYQRPKILRSDYVFRNVAIIYCDKQMYRKLIQKEKERNTTNERERVALDSLNQAEKQRRDSILKAQEEERLRINASQI